uniref:Uncharacterized protein n=1 Tax=Compsopogon caeruleus TaxID=31354 RepID=A0A6T6D870_9RHOD|mmetsp:Transcript_6589/g.13308  ORF Transcript_6589/g.13308 Transcript_6589/m.13308 type:complete len:528 (+) Transcript_6589:46-1629(+)
MKTDATLHLSVLLYVTTLFSLSFGNTDANTGFYSNPILAINVGSLLAYGSFSPDTSTWLKTSNALNFSSSLSVAGTPIPPVFQTWRERDSGNIRYLIPVPLGSYDIQFLFADFNTSGYQRNGRKLRVVVNKNKIAVDLFLATGKARSPTAATVTLANIDSRNGTIPGTLNIVVAKQRSSILGPILNGISVYKVPTPLPTPRPTLAPTRAWNLSTALAATSRYESCAVELHGRIVHLFGRNRTPMPVSVYDPASYTWTELAATPFSAHHLQCAVYNDSIIVGGAFGRGSFPLERPLNDVYLYKPNSGAWIKVTSMPAGRSRGSCGLGVYQGKWYFAGGSLLGHAQGVNFTVSFFDQYDPFTNTWTVMPDLPTRRDHGGVAVFGDKLFLLGGQVGGAADFWIQPVQQIDVFDFPSGVWTTIGETLQPHGGVSPAAVGHIIAIAGGEYNNKSSAVTEFLDASTMQLLPLTLNMTQPGGRHGFALTSCGGSFFAGQGAISKKPNDIRLKSIERLLWDSSSLCPGNTSFWSP